MKNSLVSVIIPTYNDRRWLGAAVDSALAQTYPRCEVLVVDDGSTDGTGEWLASRCGSRVRYFWKENGGLSSARNLGLRYARGEYIQFLDADDLILPRKLATHVQFLEDHPEYQVVYCHSLCFHDENPEELFDWWARKFYSSGDVLADMIDQTFMLTHAALTRSEWVERVGDFDEELSNCVDGDFWLRLANAGARFYFLPGEAMALYRIRPGSQSADSVKQRGAMLTVLSKLEKSMAHREHPRRLKIRRAIGRSQGYYGLAIMDAGETYRGWQQVAWSLVRDFRWPMPRIARLLLTPLLGWRRTQKIIHRVKLSLTKNPPV